MFNEYDSCVNDYKHDHEDRSMSNMITLNPAFGRDYSSSEYVYAAWKHGQPFRVYQKDHEWNGRMISIRDITDETVRVRFNKGTEITLIGVKE